MPRLKMLVTLHRTIRTILLRKLLARSLSCWTSVSASAKSQTKILTPCREYRRERPAKQATQDAAAKSAEIAGLLVPRTFRNPPRIYSCRR